MCLQIESTSEVTFVVGNNRGKKVVHSAKKNYILWTTFLRFFFSFLVWANIDDKWPDSEDELGWVKIIRFVNDVTSSGTTELKGLTLYLKCWSVFKICSKLRKSNNVNYRHLSVDIFGIGRNVLIVEKWCSIIKSSEQLLMTSLAKIDFT